MIFSLCVESSPIVHQPASLKFASQCEPSQNGLLLDAPQRHSVKWSREAPSPNFAPARSMPPRTPYGP